MFRASEAGGDCAAPCNRMVKGHQIRNNATITVVICMMRRALPLDSWIPLTLFHQKYAVTIVAKTVANWFGGIWKPECAIPAISLSRRPKKSVTRAYTANGTVRM